MEILFDKHAIFDSVIEDNVNEFLQRVHTIEEEHNMPIVVFQDGMNGSYYIKCSLLASLVEKLCDLNAKLDYLSPESFRANRQLLVNNKTYKKMVEDAKQGREFNDIIVEYNTEYDPEKPLKVWGGQHRTNAIRTSINNIDRYHGFRVFFRLSTIQRTELALISNTSITVSNDTFDRMVEETKFGDKLRKWCQAIGLLELNEDFPDSSQGSERISVKLARDFIVNYYLGKEKGAAIQASDIDKNIYEPYTVSTGVTVDHEYAKFMGQQDILSDPQLLEAGKNFALLHKAQYNAVVKLGSKENRKSYRNKALVESVLCGWSYVSGLLQLHPQRLANHYKLPRINSKVLDPLNSREMSEFKHDSDLVFAQTERVSIR